MSDEQIISSMVKGRECCRQLVLAYEKARAEGESPGRGHPPDVQTLVKTDRTVTRMLVHLRELPDRPETHMAQGTKRQYAVRLMDEVSDLLQRAMILEREVRENAERQRTHRTAVLKSGPSKMLRAYAGA